MTDDTFDRLLAAADRARANLVDLEHDPRRQLLGSAPLVGHTAARWAAAARALDALWDWSARLSDVLDRAAAVRGPHGRAPAARRAQVEQLLCGQSIELSRTEVPLGERALLGDRLVTVRCTPDELLAMMADAFTTVSSTVAAVGLAWDTLVPRGRAMQEQLAGLEAAATDFGGLDELARTRSRLDGIVDRIATDPLSLETTEFDALEAELSRSRGSVSAAEQLRRGLAPRITAAGRKLAELRAAVQAATDAHAELSAKIAPAGAPPPPLLDDAVGDELPRIAALATGHDWRAAARALDAWEARVDDMIERAADSARSSRAPIATRNELRGLLEAYAAMAAASGALEDAVVASRWQLAHDALYTAPADLDGAAALVRSFQELLLACHVGDGRDDRW